MSTSSGKIQGCSGASDQKNILLAVNATTASAVDISASNVSLADKVILARVRAGTATRADVNASLCNPEVKELCHAIAGT